MNIKESTELVRALGAIARRLIEDLADGKISYWEIAGFMSDFGIIKDGASGITEVPAELADLDDVERDALLAIIREQLAVMPGISARLEDASVRVLKWAFDTARMILDVRGLPPSATPA